MTLNNLIDDILLEARNSNIGESEKLSRLQIELWINNYRVYLIRQELDKKETTELDPEYVQTIKDIHLSQVNTGYGDCVFVSDIELPSLINYKRFPGIVSVKDKVGNLIQIGHETKKNFQQYRKYSCNDYIAYVKQNRLYVESPASMLEYVDVDLIAQNPQSMVDCYDPNTEYPVPAKYISTIKDLIFTKELAYLRNATSDVTNNSSDDNQNKVLDRRYR